MFVGLRYLLLSLSQPHYMVMTSTHTKKYLRLLQYWPSQGGGGYFTPPFLCLANDVGWARSPVWSIICLFNHSLLFYLKTVKSVLWFFKTFRLFLFINLSHLWCIAYFERQVVLVWNGAHKIYLGAQNWEWR